MAMLLSTVIFFYPYYAFGLVEFDRIFKTLSVDDRLAKDKMLAFFEGAGLFPTTREINAAFSTTFTGI